MEDVDLKYNICFRIVLKFKPQHIPKIAKYNIFGPQFKVLKGFVITRLTLMELLHSVFVSALYFLFFLFFAFVSDYSFILRWCMLDSLSSNFGYSQSNCPWKSLVCSVAPNASYFLEVRLTEWEHDYQK